MLKFVMTTGSGRLDILQRRYLTRDENWRELYFQAKRNSQRRDVYESRATAIYLVRRLLSSLRWIFPRSEPPNRRGYLSPNAEFYRCTGFLGLKKSSFERKSDANGIEAEIPTRVGPAGGVLGPGHVRHAENFPTGD
jgi:hypothetical protein